MSSTPDRHFGLLVPSAKKAKTVSIGAAMVTLRSAWAMAPLPALDQPRDRNPVALAAAGAPVDQACAGSLPENRPPAPAVLASETPPWARSGSQDIGVSVPRALRPTNMVPVHPKKPAVASTDHRAPRIQGAATGGRPPGRG